MLKFLGIKGPGNKTNSVKKDEGKRKRRTIPEPGNKVIHGMKRQKLSSLVSPPHQEKPTQKICSLFTRGPIKASEFKKRGKEVSAGQVVAFSLHADSDKMYVKWGAFTDDMLSKFSSHWVVHIREKGAKPTRIHLLTSLDSSTRVRWPWNTSSLTRLSPSVLKSAFQKCVRRSKPDEACRIAAALIEKQRWIGVIFKKVVYRFY